MRLLITGGSGFLGGYVLREAARRGHAVRGNERVGPRISAEQLQRLADDKVFDLDDAIRELDYAPRSFAVGIRAEAQAIGLAQ